MPAFTLPGFDLPRFVRATLDEDLGSHLPGGGRDLTAEAVIPPEARFSGTMTTREPLVLAGLPVAEAFFRALDPDVTVESSAEDGGELAAGTHLLRLEGNARALLTAE
ncbi:MAG: hypothetical protein V2I43_02060, partial [Parvularcula sp.]|nr:hypothetical protein [Parvularcula sp.]